MQSKQSVIISVYKKDSKACIKKNIELYRFLTIFQKFF